MKKLQSFLSLVTIIIFLFAPIVPAFAIGEVDVGTTNSAPTVVEPTPPVPEPAPTVTTETTAPTPPPVETTTNTSTNIRPRVPAEVLHQAAVRRRRAEDSPYAQGADGAVAF